MVYPITQPSRHLKKKHISAETKMCEEKIQDSEEILNNQISKIQV